MFNGIMPYQQALNLLNWFPYLLNLLEYTPNCVSKYQNLDFNPKKLCLYFKAGSVYLWTYFN